MTVTRSGQRLEEMIKRAIQDHEIKTSEYEEILELAQADGVVDDHERVLLRELNDLIANATVTRTAG